VQSPDEAGADKAARTQHAVALRVRAQLAANGLTVAQLADELHTDAEGLRRKLRGEKWAALQDIASWSLALGTDLLVVPDDS
jgi:hypothetical protein